MESNRYSNKKNDKQYLDRKREYGVKHSFCRCCSWGGWRGRVCRSRRSWWWAGPAALSHPPPLPHRPARNSCTHRVEVYGLLLCISFRRIFKNTLRTAARQLLREKSGDWRFGTDSIIPSLPGGSIKFIWWKLKMSYHTVFPSCSWDCPAVVCHLFLYSFICAPTIESTWLSIFCTSQLSSIFLHISGPLIFERGPQFSQLFKKTRLIPFTPPKS